jgi:hypothetical protein
VTEDRIWLIGYPVSVGLAVAEHVQDWVREFKLMGLAQQSGMSQHPVPQQLQKTVDWLTRTYATALSEPDRLRAAAAARGDATVDLPFPKQPGGDRVVRGWQQLLADVDDYCRHEQLLTLERTPSMVALNDWIADEFTRQLAGKPPIPWHCWPAGAGSG